MVDPSPSTPSTTPGQAPPSGSPASSAASASGASSGDSGVVSDVVALAEGAADYIADLLRLEGFRLETQARLLLRRLWLLVAAGAIALLGLFFVSLGAAAWASTWLGSPPAGLALVGAVYLAVGGLIALVVSRRRVAAPEPRDRDRSRDSTSRPEGPAGSSGPADPPGDHRP